MKYTKYIVKANEKAFRPSVFWKLGWKDDLKGWWVELSPSCKYQFPPDQREEQDDWYKLCGISYHLFTNHRDSAMVGWRWDPAVNRFELCAYWHVDGEKGMSDVLCLVRPDELFGCWIETDYKLKKATVFIYVPGRDERTCFVINYSNPLGPITREIGAYAGGTLPAQHDMALYKKRIIYYGNGIAYFQPPS